MKVTVLYFASLREALGSRETIEVEPGITLGGLRDTLLARGGRHAEVLARSRAVRCALNQVMSDETAVLDERAGEVDGTGAEVAFFPPVTGG